MLVFIIAAVLLGVATAQSGRCNFHQSNETAGRVYMVKGDCTFYYQCNNGSEHVRRPCKDDEVYNPWIGKCVSNTEHVNCDLSPDYYARYDQLCTTTEEGSVAVPFDLSKFVLCWRYTFRFPPMSCSNGLIFNQEKGICDHVDPDKPSNSNPVPVEPQQYDGNGNGNFYGGFAPGAGYEPDNIGHAVCIYQPVPGDCTRYTYCNGDPEVIGQCAEGTVMSRSKRGCVYCTDLTPSEKNECNLRC